MPFFRRHSHRTPNGERKRTWFATKLSHLRLHLFDNLYFFFASLLEVSTVSHFSAAASSFSFLFISFWGRRDREEKSVISNFLIVIVFVLYCVPLWLFLWFIYEIYAFFSFFSAASTTAHLAQEDHYYAF